MPDAGLEVTLSSAPPRLGDGAATAFLIAGTARSDAAPIRSVRVAPGAPDASILTAGHAPSARDPGGEDFWALAAYPNPGPGPIGPSVEVMLETGVARSFPATEIEVSSEGAQQPPDPAGDSPAVAICMATYEPDADLFRRQIDSIREQRMTEWRCLISDDRSSDAAYATIGEIVGDDPRFAISRSPERLGFYRNYERALRMVPRDARFVAFADQDDRWQPDKLETLREAIGQSQLAYSDARIVGPRGEIQAPTYWTRRRNNFTDLASMALANTVSGSAALFRRDLLDLALPFPPAHSRYFHDHWIAFCALASGDLAYVDRPLYDYVQHPRATLGHARAHAWADRDRGRRARILHALDDPDYFHDHWRVTYFSEFCRTLAFAATVSMRAGDRLPAPKRAELAPLLGGERSPRLLGWLLARAARGRRHTQTLGAEGRILRALTWRGLLAVSARLGRGGRLLPRGAGPPEYDPTAGPGDP